MLSNSGSGVIKLQEVGTSLQENFLIDCSSSLFLSKAEVVKKKKQKKATLLEVYDCALVSCHIEVNLRIECDSTYTS